MMSISGQTDDQLGGPTSVLVLQRRDHRRLDALLAELESAAPSEQPAVLQRISRLVFTHAFAEEAVLWPTMRKVLPDGDELTSTVEREHQEINELASRLDTTAIDDPGRAQLLERIVDWLRRDVRDEEDVLLPRLQEALTPVQLRRLGLAWEAVRRIAPTRAHPVVARRPPGQTLSALPLTVLDRSRDALDRRARTDVRRGPTLERASSALGATSHRVEQLKVFRMGERGK